MYTDEDLGNAVDAGIFSRTSVAEFRDFISKRNQTSAVDEETFRLVASFNDIFVVIACALLLFSASWVMFAINPVISAASVALLSWGLAEFFVRKRRMALPAIMLLLTFTVSVFAIIVAMFVAPTEGRFPSSMVLMLSAAVTGVAVWFHWKRFNVPITVAAGAATVLIFVISLLLSVFPGLKEVMLPLLFIAGLIMFVFAMAWDSADVKRITGKSDVAFWLHLGAAPLIVHPIFAGLGILEGNESTVNILFIVTLYIVLTLISLIIDRRAFMVSSLIYVLYALTALLKSYGLAGDSFAFVGVFIGFSLLLLSGFWHKARHQVIRFMPAYIQSKVPVSV